MDAAAEIADRDGLKGDDRAALIFAAMSHDLAKATTTEQREKGGRMRWTAHGHEEASGPMAEELMKSIGIKKEIIQRVRPIIERHLEHIRFKPGTTSPAQVRQLADALHPATIEELARLMEADASGRPPLPKGLPEEARLMLELARQDGSHAGRPQPLVQGRDVMPYFQNQGGKHIGEAVQEAYKAQLKAKITTVEQARAWLDNHIKSRASLLRGTDVLPYFDNKGGPHIADVLTQAWQAQRAGEFDSPEGARAWLDAYMQNQPPASS
jgi:tRNA nucleotidyltransferase (CCA-adding enzyme)